MSEETITKIFEMISAAGAARSNYIGAVQAAKKGDFENAEKLMQDGGGYFGEAHRVHAELLAKEADGIETSGEQSCVSLILVHAEDQMMCAESFRIIAEELIEVHRELNELKRG